MTWMRNSHCVSLTRSSIGAYTFELYLYSYRQQPLTGWAAWRGRDAGPLRAAPAVSCATGLATTTAPCAGARRTPALCGAAEVAEVAEVAEGKESDDRDDSEAQAGTAVLNAVCSGRGASAQRELLPDKHAAGNSITREFTWQAVLPTGVHAPWLSRSASPRSPPPRCPSPSPAQPTARRCRAGCTAASPPAAGPRPRTRRRWQLQAGPGPPGWRRTPAAPGSSLQCRQARGTSETRLGGDATGWCRVREGRVRAQAMMFTLMEEATAKHQPEVAIQQLRHPASSGAVLVTHRPAASYPRRRQRRRRGRPARPRRDCRAKQGKPHVRSVPRQWSA